MPPTPWYIVQLGICHMYTWARAVGCCRIMTVRAKTFNAYQTCSNGNWLGGQEQELIVFLSLSEVKYNAFIATQPSHETQTLTFKFWMTHFHNKYH